MKIEFDIPDFKRELKIEITLRKDGEVIYTSSSARPITADEGEEIPRSVTKTEASDKTPENTSGGRITGGSNMMNIEL